MPVFLFEDSVDANCFTGCEERAVCGATPRSTAVELLARAITSLQTHGSKRP